MISLVRVGSIKRVINFSTFEYHLSNKCLVRDFELLRSCIRVLANPYFLTLLEGFPGGSNVKESACDAGDPGSITGLGRSPGEGNVYPFQYSCLDRGAWWATAHRVLRAGHK